MTEYTVELDMARPWANIDDRASDAILDQLTRYHPALSEAPRGMLRLTLTLPAEDAVQAADTARALAERVTGSGVVAITAMPTTEWDAREGFEPVPDLVGTTEAAQILGITRQRVLQLADTGELPGAPVGKKSIAFPRAAVEARARRHQRT